MRFVALIVWFVTALWGLYMLAVWLIENDATRQGNSAQPAATAGDTCPCRRSR